MALLSFFKKKSSKHKKELINKDDNEELKSLDDKETSENDLINRKYSLNEIITTCVLHVCKADGIIKPEEMLSIMKNKFFKDYCFNGKNIIYKKYASVAYDILNSDYTLEIIKNNFSKILSKQPYEFKKKLIFNLYIVSLADEKRTTLLEIKEIKIIALTCMNNDIEMGKKLSTEIYNKVLNLIKK